MADKENDRQKTGVRKRTVTAHDGLLFGGMHPTSSDMDEHEKMVEDNLRRAATRIRRRESIWKRLFLSLIKKVFFLVVIVFVIGFFTPTAYKRVFNQRILQVVSGLESLIKHSKLPNKISQAVIAPEKMIERKAKEEELDYPDDIFIFYNSENLFSQFPGLEDIFTNTRKIDFNYVKEIIASSKKNLDQELLNKRDRLELRLYANTWEDKKYNLSQEHIEELYENYQEHLKEILKFQEAGRLVLFNSKIKYKKWMEIRELLAKNDFNGIRSIIQSENKEDTDLKKEFLGNLISYERLVKDKKEVDKNNLEETKNKINMQINSISSKIFYTLTLVADALSQAEKDQGIIEKYILEENWEEKKLNLPKNYMESLKKSLMQDKKEIEDIDKLVNQKDRRSYRIFEKINSL